MTPVDVLRIHNFFCKKFNQLLPVYITGNKNDLTGLKDKLKKLTAQYIGNLGDIVAQMEEVFALGQSNMPEILSNLSIKAFAIACEKMKDVNDFDEYKIGFENAYLAALGVELYCQFLTKDIMAYYDKICLTSSNAPTSADLVEALSQDVKLQFNQFVNVKDSLSADDISTVNEIEQQLNALINTLQGQDLLKTKQASLDFQISAGQLMRRFHLKYESDESWEPFLFNMLLTITVFGALLTAVSAIHNAVTGHYLFFDKPVIRETTLAERAPEDLLLDTRFSPPTRL